MRGSVPRPIADALSSAGSGGATAGARSAANPYAAPMAEPSKAVLITGCSSGIGRATALRLARSGWTVYASARRPESIAELGDAGCRTLALDVTDEESMRAAVDTVEQARGRGRGADQQRRLQPERRDRDGARWRPCGGSSRRTSSGSCASRSSSCRRCARSAGARSSTSARWAAACRSPAAGNYHATKYALEAISDALRFELRGFGIDVILLEPGLITTEFGEAATASMADVGLGGGPLRALQRDRRPRSPAGAYDGPMRRLGAGPDRVAKVIERAITRRHPPARITVTRLRQALDRDRGACSATARGTRRCARSFLSRSSHEGAAAAAQEVCAVPRSCAPLDYDCAARPRRRGRPTSNPWA